MNIRVLCFAGLKEIVGEPQLEFNLPAACTVKEFRELLIARFPQLRSNKLQLLIAINGVYADEAQIISPGAELACFPPVSGG